MINFIEPSVELIKEKQNQLNQIVSKIKKETQYLKMFQKSQVIQMKLENQQNPTAHLRYLRLD